MNGSGQMTSTVADLLYSHDRKLSETARLCHEARHGRIRDYGKQTLETVFQDSLQLKIRMNELEKLGSNL